MISQTLDDCVLLLGCGAQGHTEVGIVLGATGMKGHESLETGIHGLEPSWGITLGARAWLPRPGEQGLAWLAPTASKDCPALISWQS